MTHRSILTGQTPNVVIRAGGNVDVEGWDSERLLAETNSRWGLKIERRSKSEIGHVRARVGDHVPLDMPIDVVGWTKKNARGEVTQVQIGGSGKVLVPLGSNVKVYAGRGANVRDIQGNVAVYAGRDVNIRNIRTLVHVAAGRAMDLECEAVEGNDVKFTAGRDLRCYIRELKDAKLMVNDLGGYWEGIIGNGRTKIRLKAGGDVTVVTDQDVTGDLIGKIEKPDDIGRKDVPA